MGFWNTLGKITGAISGVGPLLELGGSVVNAISGSNAQKKANETNMAIANQNNQTSIDIANKNNQASIDLQRENNEFNRQQAIDMFNMEANYNSPEQQVARLREAGINPSAFYAGQGQVSTGNENASAPQAASAGVSFQQPNLMTPQVSAIPSIAGGFIGALEQLARIQNIKQNTKKQGAETKNTEAQTNRIVTLLGDELQSLILGNKGEELRNSYQEFENLMQPLYADQRLKETAQRITNLAAEYNNLMATGEVLKAEKALKDIQAVFTDTQNTQLKESTPLILANLRRQGQLIEAQTKTQGSMSYYYDMAGDNQAETAETTAQLRPYEVSIKKIERGIKAMDFQKDYKTFKAEVNAILAELNNRPDISDATKKKLQSDADKARTQADWEEWNQALNTAVQINKGASEWKPLNSVKKPKSKYRNR